MTCETRTELDPGEPRTTTEVAGLQYYDYGKLDDVLGRRVIPAAGDRLALVRRPDNKWDTHAVEVWWGNGHLLGHLPRVTARELAPRLDAGLVCRAYVRCPGNGSRWSMSVELVGSAIVSVSEEEPVDDEGMF